MTWENPQGTFIWVLRFLPTKLCFSESHSGAARTPLATRAKNAFLTCLTKKNWSKSRIINIELKSWKWNVSYTNSEPLCVFLFSFWFCYLCLYLWDEESVCGRRSTHQRAAAYLGLLFNRFMTAPQTMQLILSTINSTEKLSLVDGDTMPIYLATGKRQHSSCVLTWSAVSNTTSLELVGTMS